MESLFREKVHLEVALKNLITPTFYCQIPTFFLRFHQKPLVSLYAQPKAMTKAPAMIRYCRRSSAHKVTNRNNNSKKNISSLVK